MENYFKCEKCKDSISKFAIGRHLKTCKGIFHNRRKTINDINTKEKISIKINDNLFECLKCHKQFKKLGISSHYWRNHTKKGKKFNSNLGYIKGTRKAWNKGLTSKTDNRVLKGSKTLKEAYESGRLIHSWIGRKHSKKTKKKLKLKCGGYRENAGRSEKFYVVDSFGTKTCLQSSYELKVSQILDKLKIKWTRPKPFNWIDSKKVNHKYYPDFYLEDFNIYLDPKNDYLIKLDKDKINRVKKQNKIDLRILNQKDLTEEYFRKITEKVYLIILSEG
jgi:hypothetical protein